MFSCFFRLDTFSDVYDSDDHIIARHPNSLFDAEQKQKYYKPQSRHSRKRQNFIQAEASTNRDIFQVHSGLNSSVQDVNDES